MSSGQSRCACVIIECNRERNGKETAKEATHNSCKEVRLESDDGIGPWNEVPSSLLHGVVHGICKVQDVNTKKTRLDLKYN